MTKPEQLAEQSTYNLSPQKRHMQRVREGILPPDSIRERDASYLSGVAIHMERVRRDELPPAPGNYNFRRVLGAETHNNRLVRTPKTEQST